MIDGLGWMVSLAAGAAQHFWPRLFFSLAFGLVVGMIHGIWAGLATAVVLALLWIALDRALQAIVRKSRETRIPQRHFPGGKKP